MLVMLSDLSCTFEYSDKSTNNAAACMSRFGKVECEVIAALPDWRLPPALSNEPRHNN